MATTRVLLLAGGQSDEHEVSLLSARGVCAALRGMDLDVVARVLTRDGGVLSAADSQQAIAQGQVAFGGEPLSRLHEAALSCEVVFPLLHGPMGEDGTVQGLLTMLRVPFVGSGVLGSALCMDKAMCKDVLRAHGLPQVDYALVTAGSWAHRREAMWPILQPLGSTVFVKPANLGSSVGVRKAQGKAQIAEAIEHALRYDRRVIVEAAAQGIRECEVAVLGNETPRASVVGEITYQSEFYDYATKYTEGRSRMVVPASLPPAIAERMRALSLQAFALLDAAGLCRVDFFYQPSTEQIWLNELNTMPGFTPFSMYPTLWQHTGVPYHELLGELVALARARAERRH